MEWGMIIMPIKERSSSTGRKYQKDSNILANNCTAGPSSPLLRTHSELSQWAKPLGLQVGSAKCQSLGYNLKYNFPC